MQYSLRGKNTYNAKDVLKSMGCEYCPTRKVWLSPIIEKDSYTHKKLRELALGHEFEIAARIDHNDALNKIQEILNRNKV